ncbi:helix-turn-helix transcriptional regulator [Solibacillus sp. FSL W8-0372]|uniref:helix-turn-helix transcriptional regulator n=1 Tax=Solibacillus sp. FSL W8-0372 TaxID=2921713 RepID=UPI0030CE7E6E
MEKRQQSWGKLLKYYRQKKKLKQDEVAAGLCTPSYLSRIENGIVIAEYALYEQLFAKLNIDFSSLQHDISEHTAFMESVYEKLLSNVTVAESDIELLTTLMQNEYSVELQVTAKLIYSRYLYSIKEDIDARKLLDEIEPVISWKKDRITELFVSITTFGHLSFMEFDLLAKKEQQEQHVQYLSNAHPFELANYHYHIAFANHRSYQFQKALQHIELAVHYYTHQFKPLFQLKLYSMKGVIYNDLHRFRDALQEYEAGIELLKNVESIQTPMQWSSLHNNIAYCYECQQDFQQASKHYETANEYDEDLHSVINWMRTCYQHKDFSQLEMLFHRYEDQRFSIQHHIYQRKLLQYAVQQEQTIHGLKELEEQAFSHFNEEQYYALILFYAPLWGQFYEQLHAYKHASQCYKQALFASEKVRQRMSS